MIYRNLTAASSCFHVRTTFSNEHFQIFVKHTTYSQIKVPQVSQNSLVTPFFCLYCFGLQPSSYLKLWIGTLAVNPKLVPNALLQLLQWQSEVRASSRDSRSSEYRSF